MPVQPSRRALLAVTTLAGLGGCTAAPPGTSTRSSTDGLEQTVAATAREAAALREAALAAARGATGSLRRTLLNAASTHGTHLVALGHPVAPAGTTTAAPTGTVGSATAAAGSVADPRTEQEQARAAADARAEAEWLAAGSALTAGLAVGAGALALLLVRIAAARSVHADLLDAQLGRPARATAGITSQPAPPTQTPTQTQTQTPTPVTATSATPSSTPSPGSVFASPTEQALNRALAGDHAAVYAYPIVIARVERRTRAAAERAWAAHRVHRDLVQQRLLSAGVQPVAARPAYAVSPVPTDEASATALAARIEGGLAALAADVVATAPVGEDRALGARSLVAAARRVAGYTGRVDPLPGAAATPTASVSATG